MSPNGHAPFGLAAILQRGVGQCAHGGLWTLYSGGKFLPSPPSRSPLTIRGGAKSHFVR